MGVRCCGLRVQCQQKHKTRNLNLINNNKPNYTHTHSTRRTRRQISKAMPAHQDDGHPSAHASSIFVFFFMFSFVKLKFLCYLVIIHVIYHVVIVILITLLSIALLLSLSLLLSIVRYMRYKSRAAPLVSWARSCCSTAA